MAERIQNGFGREVGCKNRYYRLWFGDNSEAGGITANLQGRCRYRVGRNVALHIDCDHQGQTQICSNLELLGFELHKTTSAQAAKQILNKHFCRLVLIYFDIIDEKIFKFCSFVSFSSPDTIVIVLMPKPKINLEEKLFDYGVNDVVSGEQTSAGVLTKRIKAHLLHSSEPFCRETNLIRLKDTIIDFDSGVVWCDGNIRQLTGMLPDLLKYFLSNPNRIISRQELYESVLWADSICSPAREGGKTFDVGVSKLRKAIESDPSEPEIIKTVRRKGWILKMDIDFAE